MAKIFKNLSLFQKDMISEKITTTVLEKCMNLQKNETCLIVADTRTKELAKPFFETAKQMVGKQATFVVMEPRKNNGDEPTPEVKNTMMSHNVQLLITSKSLSHTDARRTACQKGARIASMPGITKDILERCVDLDYLKLNNINEQLRSVLIGSSVISITGENGTNITTAVTVTHGIRPGQFHKPGDFGNLPSGEVDSGVILEKTNGTLVVDCSMAGIGKLKSPLTFTIEKGIVTSITGNKAEELKTLLDSIGQDAYKIAELGIGTNPKAKITGNILEDEKVKGTFHMALGNDVSYNGTNNIPLHLDGISNKPTIVIDGKTIMKNGSFCFP